MASLLPLAPAEPLVVVAASTPPANQIGHDGHGTSASDASHGTNASHASHATPASSPAAVAAAVTLATLADSRPPTSPTDDESSAVQADADDYGHVDDDEDEDPGGGIALEGLNDFVEPPVPSTYNVDPMDSTTANAPTATLPPWEPFQHPFSNSAPVWSSALAPLSSFPPDIPTLPFLLGQMTDTMHPPGPPYILQETYLSVHDRTSFAPITFFFHSSTPKKVTVPGLDLIHVPDSITAQDLQGDKYDYQGIDWTVRNTTRSAIRAKRVEYEYWKLAPSLKEMRKRHVPVPSTERTFRFKRNNTKRRPFFPHFQLRNVLAVSSRNDIYYSAGHSVFRTDAEGACADVVANLGERLGLDGSITTIATNGNVLVAGGFDGEYAITDLASTFDSPCTFGQTEDLALDAKSRIVNHLHVFEARTTYAPQAAICSNDRRLRILDCLSGSITQCFVYPAAVNCAATSPNGRMRVVVGDFQETLITNAETGKPFETLASHTDDAFACAWADDGIHVATAAQDSTIVIWDARRWEKPLAVIMSELSVPRSLHFSPIGSGPRVLVAAEADDYVNIINAQTFESKQVIDFFGPIGGTSFTPDGQSLFVANGDRRFGGIVELERTGWAEKPARRPRWDSGQWDDFMMDWDHDDMLNDDEQVVGGEVERRRRCVDVSDVIV